MSNKVMELLNNDERARKVRSEFEEFLQENPQLSEEEIEKERQGMISMCILLVPEALAETKKDFLNEVNF